MNTNAPTNIIWAVNPFDRNSKVAEAAAAAIAEISKWKKTAVLPVYVESVFRFDLLELPAPAVDKATSTAGEQLLEKIAKKFKLPKLERLKILRSTNSRKSAQTQDLLEFAKKKKSQLIVLGSHGRSGPKRWVLGSFAESLALKAKTPLLIVKPQSKRPMQFQEILFPTDFSKESKNVFAHILKTAPIKDTKITIFAKLGMVGLPSIDYVYVSSEYYDSLIKEEEAHVAKESAKLLLLAKKIGFKVEFAIDRNRATSVADAIIEKAKRGLIVMAAKSGPAESILIGSTTQQVIRGAEVPVWVLRP